MVKETYPNQRFLMLDIDGVLVTYKSCMAFIDQADAANDHSHVKLFDPTGVAVLNKVCKDLDLKIIVSSTWRIINNTTAKMHGILIKNGFNKDILQHVPDSRFKSRNILSLE